MGRALERAVFFKAYQGWMHVLSGNVYSGNVDMDYELIRVARAEYSFSDDRLVMAWRFC